MSRKALTWLSCLLAGIAMTTGTWLLNTDIIAVFTAINPAGRDIIFVLGSILPYFVIGFIARKQASLLPILALSLISSFIAVTGSALFILSPLYASSAGLNFSFFLCLICRPWAYILLFLALCQLKEMRTIALCLCLFLAAGYFSQWLVGFLLPAMRVSLLALTLCFSVLLTYPLAKQTIRNTPAAEVANLALQQPRAFISFFNLAFLGILVLRFVYGFVLAFNSTAGVPVDTFFTGFVAVFIGIWLYIRGKERAYEDALFSIAALIVVAGMLVTLVSLPAGSSPLSNIILSFASTIFTVLQYLVILSMCLRNQHNALTVISCGQAFSSIGVLIGASTGHALNLFLGQQGNLALTGTALMLFIFVVFCFVWLKKFSYKHFIHGIEKVKPLLIAKPDDPSSKSFKERCDDVSRTHGLTKRETEILSMLARGRNGKFIQNYYTLSYNTVKTHVKHIYMKLDIHSQQDLINLVEQAQSAAPQDSPAVSKKFCVS